MNAANYIVKAIRDQGTDHLFMCPGGLNDTFMAPMTETDGVRTIVAAFEGGAAYMADGFARASGGIGACFGIGGPGVMNMITALAGAGADRSPVLAVSGEVPRSWEGMGGFQDASGAAIDDVTTLKPITAESLSVSSVAVLPHHLRHAVTVAFAERRPVHLSVPVDVQKSDIAYDWQPVGEGVTNPHFVDESEIARVADLFTGHDSPKNVVILAGPGVIHVGATDALAAFAEKYDIPVATTLGGKGLISEDHPLALGVFGYGGSHWAIDAIRDTEVEVLIVVGSGLSQRDTMQWDERMLPSRALIHIERNPTLIGRTWASEIAVVGDARTALEHLSALAGEAAAGLDSGRGVRRAFLERIQKASARIYNEDDTTSAAVPMHPARVVTELRNAMPDDGVLCVDSGAHRAWLAEYWTVREPGTHFSLTNLGPMGGAIPLGIGAKLARPDRPLMVGTGDGCMLMHGMEIHTAARERVPMVVAIMNNRAYGNIWYRAHKLGEAPEKLTEIPGIDWVGFAESMGARAEAVTEPAAIGAAMERALSADGPYVLDLHTDKTYPTPVGPWRERQGEWEDHE